MKFRARKHIKIGRYSWNSRTRKSHFDTPGPGSVEFGGKSSTKK